MPLFSMLYSPRPSILRLPSVGLQSSVLRLPSVGLQTPDSGLSGLSVLRDLRDLTDLRDLKPICRTRVQRYCKKMQLLFQNETIVLKSFFFDDSMNGRPT